MAVRGQTGCELPAAFWEEFVASHMNKQPCVSGPQLPVPILTVEEAMAGLLAAAAKPAEMRIRMYVDGQQVESGRERLEWLPRDDDRTLDGYSRRLRTLAAERPFAITVNEFARHSRVVWNKVRELMSGLHRLTGFPVAGIETVLFHGTHPWTPGGIHYDGVDTFAFAVRGEKTMLIWPPDFFEKSGIPVFADRAGAGPEQCVEQAVQLPLIRDGFAYWPQGYWHVGISSHRAVTTSLSLGLCRGTLNTEILGLIASDHKPLRLCASGPDLPVEFTEAVERIGRSLESPASKLLLHVHWLRLATASGCIPAPWDVVDLADGDILEPSPQRRWLLADHGDGMHIMAANGHALAIHGGTWLEDVAHWLENEGRRRVVDLMANLSSDRDRPACRRLLTMLVRAGALRRDGAAADRA